jgi:hypothetical protein
MAVIRELRTRVDRLRQDEADTLRQALLPFETGSLAPHVRSIAAVLIGAWHIPASQQPNRQGRAYEIGR